MGQISTRVAEHHKDTDLHRKNGRKRFTGAIVTTEDTKMTGHE